MSSHLSLPVRLPFDARERHARLDVLTKLVANTLIERYWTPEHLTGIDDYSYQAWKYFDENEAFADVDLYLPSRYKRCVMQKVGETLRSHADKQEAFQSIQSVLPDHKIRRIHTRRIKEQLWDSEEYIKSGYVELLIGQLNSYYDRHGRFPDSYFDMQDCPTYSKGVLPYSADDGPTSGQAVKYEYTQDTQTLTVKLKTPDTLEPETRGDWTWTKHELEGYEAFHELLDHGSLSAPSFHPTQTKTGSDYHELSFSIEVEHQEKSDDVKTVLAIDGGLRKDATAIVVNEDGGQLSVPYFIQNTEREQMRNLARERNQLNSKLAYLRRNGRNHRDSFRHVQAEYERVNNKIRHKREQLVHDVANQVLALALVYDVDAIVHEDLRSLSPPRGEGQLSWELSSWARREIISKLEYRAEIAGLHVEKVCPGNTSRSCPRCGATGHTTKSPDHSFEVWWGGHFRCDNARCGFQADRDYVGAVNVARVFFSETATLEHGFTSSYTGDVEIVPASRSAGPRLAFGEAPIVFTGQSKVVTAGGGSCFIAPAVTPTETKTNSSNTNSVSSPATHSASQFVKQTAVYCRK
ncbi:IS1341-type transposase ISHgi6 [Haloferax gibbonsii]|uniref:IS1341-type transposase ISHgi6 n=1 Tax=Haloferax gibbonsii TaxID=35746 RepID=A0A871BCX1_HALGI|nr:zinc ribbon domain-containing protein [Haloferax gibbonsii]QOS10715.1 IS1341-type transposase ISHgi6 [Haloferax gibbonsii]